MAARKNPAPRTDALATIITEVVAADPELRDDARELARDLMRSARRMMLVGTADVKLNLFKAVLPQMLKAVGSVEADEQEREREEARRRMMLGLAGRGDSPLNPPSAVANDAPPAPAAKRPAPKRR
jgi:enoyl-CoA hydratase/carnithine racemase